MEAEGDGALELGVPAPGASIPPAADAVPGGEADVDAMNIKKNRKRIRGCLDEPTRRKSWHE
eukprot:5910316-Amphidinium_carterae.1